MSVNPDFRDLFAAFADAEVRFLVVGAYAVSFHARPRFTKDLDVWIDPDPVNAARAHRALASFGAPLEGVSPEDLEDPETILQIGVAPNRIDILSSVEGLDFTPAWARRVQSRYGNQAIHLLSREDLIRSKRASGRPQDLLDVEALEADAEE